MSRLGASMLGLAMLCAPAEGRTLRLEDLLQLERLESPQISPDGDTVVYTRTRVNVEEDRFEGEVWVMDVNGNGNRRLLSGGATEVRWSPDSTRIAYLGRTETGPEIFVRRMDAQGGTIQVTWQGMSPGSVSWSPDGQWIAFIAKVPAPVKWAVGLPGKPKNARWAEDPIIVDELHYRLDGIGYTSAGGHSHIHVVSAHGGTSRQLTDGQWHAEPQRAGMTSLRGDLEWTPDSRSIVFSADIEGGSALNYARANLYSVDVSTARIRPLTRGDGFWGLVPGPRVSPDGKQIAFVGTQASNTSNNPALELRVIRIDGTGERILVDDLPGRMAGGKPAFLEWAANGRRIHYVVEHAGARNVYTVSLQGKVSRLTTGAQSIALSSVSDTGMAVGTVSTADAAPEIMRVSLQTGGMQTLTAINAKVLRDVRLGQVEEIWYESSDSTKVQGWIVYPPDFDPTRKYPLVLDIHGGPENMYEGSFEFTFQDMAAAGYVVLYTNPRGSTGYGSAFSRAIHDAFPGRVDYEDLMNGVDAVVGRGFVDAERLYVQGCSGGGALTAWVVTQTDRFAAAAAMCPIVNMISFAGSTDIPGWAFNRFRKPFWIDPTAWLASSAIMHVSRVKTPTLILSGENDMRTPVAQAQELYTALRMLDVPTRLILMRNESHGVNTFKPSNVLRTQLYLRKWYGEWRRGTKGGKPVWRRAEQP
jgi:dipeptidyl aminopeptidase/acylaminoacyl peptidase